MKYKVTLYNRKTGAAYQECVYEDLRGVISTLEAFIKMFNFKIDYVE